VHKNQTLRAALLAIACSVSLAAAAQGGDVKSISIPAGELSGALDVLAKQSGVEFIYHADQLKGVRTDGVNGNLSADEALTRLLRGSGFTTKRDVSGAILIIRDNTPAPKPPGPKKQPESASASPVAEAPPAEMEKISVTGSRLLQATIEGPQEMKVYTARDIAQSGRKTVTDFLNTLSAVSTVVTEARADIIGGASTVRLRGLPVGSTLVLLDGRSVEGSGVNQSFGSPFDINNIPIALVERIEVVPEAASAVYGSDAIGGVVNIILRKDLDGGEISATTGGPTEGGYRDSTVSAAWGKKFDRGNIALVGSYQVRGALLSTDRELTANKDYRRYGGRDARSSACMPGNVYSEDGSPLPGLPTSSAGIPYHTGTLTPSDFLATAGIRNRCSSGQFGETIVPSTRRTSLMASGHYELGTTTQAFFQAMYSQVRQGIYLAPEGLSQVPVPADNPFNPFHVPVLVDYRFASEGRSGSMLGRDHFSRLLGGLKGAWGDHWDWEVAAWQSSDHLNGKDTNTLDYDALYRALANTDPTQSVDLFSSGSPASRAVLDSLFTDSPVVASSKLQAVNGFARGSLFDLPAGAVNVVIGGEYNHVQQALWAPGQGLLDRESYSRNVRSAFGEAHIPLLAADTDSGGEKLALTLAGRYDDYSDFGKRFTPQGGLEFRPTETLLLRASYAEAYKAPDLRAVYGAPIVYQGQDYATDPFRGGEVYPIAVQFGGNLKLKPQTGSSRSFGFVWSSTAVENLQVGLTQFHVTQSDRIIAPNPLTIIANPDVFAGRVVRAAPTPEDIAKGYLGRITSIDARYTNYGRLTAEGFDLDLSYKIETGFGTFRPALNVTEIYKYSAAVAPGAPLEDRLSRANTDAYAARWKGTASLGYSYGAWSAQAAARYLSSYLDYDRARELGDYWTFDASLHYDFGKGVAGEDSFLSKAYADVAVVNAFNRMPQYSSYSAGYDPRMADIRGRLVSITLGTRW